MTDFLQDLIAQITPEFFSFLAVVLGAALTKLTGVWRSNKLHKKLYPALLKIGDQVRDLQAEGIIKESLARALYISLLGFARNAAQIEKKAIYELGWLGASLKGQAKDDAD